MTVHCWGERAAGEWTLEIQDTPSQVRSPTAQGKGTKPQGALPKVGKKPQMLLCKGWAEPAAGPCPPSLPPGEFTAIESEVSKIKPYRGTRRKGESCNFWVFVWLRCWNICSVGRSCNSSMRGRCPSGCHRAGRGCLSSAGPPCLSPVPSCPQEPSWQDPTPRKGAAGHETSRLGLELLVGACRFTSALPESQQQIKNLTHAAVWHVGVNCPGRRCCLLPRARNLFELQHQNAPPPPGAALPPGFSFQLVFLIPSHEGSELHAAPGLCPTWLCRKKTKTKGAHETTP